MPRKPSLSRRSLLRGAAGAGAAGLAAGALGTTGTTTHTATSGTTGTTGASAATLTAATEKTPLVVHVRDARTGDIEVFAGPTQTRLRDRDLAARIAGAIS